MKGFLIGMTIALSSLAVLAQPVEAACNPKEGCRRCLAKQPRVCVFGSCSGGKCIQHYNDPSCEARKAACNVCILGLIKVGISPQEAMKRC